MRSPRSTSGQATVELVALVPILALVALVLWQLAVAGHAVGASGAAARMAARAQAVGGDPSAAARRSLPRRLQRGLRVRAEGGGEVTVAVPIPAILGGDRLATATGRARFEPQE